MAWFMLVVGCILLAQVSGSKWTQNTDNLRRFNGKYVPYAKRLLRAGNNATFFSNTVVKILCNVPGYHSATWLANGKVIDKTLEGVYKVKNGSLVLKNGVSGQYTCIVRNNSGKINLTSFIRYADPEAPKIHSSIKPVTILSKAKKHSYHSVTVGTNATVYSQSILVLVCNVTGFPPPIIRWKKNGKIMTKYASGNKLLLIHDPSKSGQYMCKAKNYLGSAKRTSHIKFIEPSPPLINLSKKKLLAIHGENHVYMKIGDHVTTIVGTAVDIQCLASGVPKPTYTWYRNSRILHLNEENYFYNQAIPANASGNYTCIARNAFGTTQATSYLKVIEPVFPFINSSEQDMVSYDMARPFTKTIGGTLETLVGASISLECPAYGIPAPDITWERENIPLATGKRMRISGNRVNLLGILMSDTGWYSCKATNGAGSVTKSTFVLLIAPEMPRIKKVNHRYHFIFDNLPTPFSANVGIDLRILAHREVTIHCVATGFPKPVLSWRRDGKPITNTSDIYVSPLGSKIVFKYLTVSQSSTYSCVASNAAGQDIARTTIIARLPLKPRIEITTTVLSKYKPSRQRNMEVYEIALTQPRLVRGSDVLLECVARKGYPSSTFKWYKNGRPLYYKTKEMFNRSRLKIRNLQPSDQGIYKCFASNNVGEHETTTKLYFEGANAH